MLTNKKNLNEAIVRAIKRDWYSGTGEKRDYSVTQLLVPPKIYHLLNRHKDEVEEDVSERMFMLMGSAMHAILERANEHDVEFTILSRVRAFFEKVHNGEIDKNPDEIEASFINFIVNDADATPEKRLGYMLSLLPEDRYLIEKRFRYTTKTGKIISGGIDLYDRKTRTLHDYKFSSVYTWIYRNRPGNRTEEWAQQLNMYRLFLEQQGYPVDKICINLIMRDYSKSKGRYDSTYPDPVETIELPLFGLDVVEQMIENKVAELEKYNLTKDDAIPACTSLERWQHQDTYAIYKVGNKKASKVEYSYSAATSWMENEIQNVAEKDISKGMDSAKAYNRAKEIYRIEKRPGTPTRCIDYCAACKFCDFYRSLPEDVKNGNN